MKQLWCLAVMALGCLLFTLAACSYDSPSGVDVPPDGSDATTPAGLGPHRKPITITITNDVALDEFPVSVLLANDADLAAGTTGGADLVFAAADGTTVLPSEIVAFDAATGALDAWVRVSLATPTTTIYVYYGRAAITSPQPWTGYAGVWHMHGNAAVLADSTPAQHHVTSPDPASTPASADGIVGAARSYDGNDHAILDDPPDGSLDFPQVSFSYSLWVFVTQSLGTFDIPFHKGGSSTGNPGYDMELGTGNWNAAIHDTVNNRATAFGADVNLEDNWAHLVAVVDRTAATFTTFANGMMASQQTITLFGSLDSGNDLEIGRVQFPFNGRIDEVRIFGDVMSAARVSAEFRNATDRANFIAVGAEEDL